MSTTTIAQRYTESVQDAASKQSALRLSIGMAAATFYAVSRLTSLVQGRDIRYVGDARPMTASRHTGNALMMGLNLLKLATGGMVLRSHLKPSDNEADTPGLARSSSRDLVSSAISSSIVSAMFLRELNTGRSLGGKFPLSAYGRATNVVSLAVATYVVVTNAKLLYERRAKWLPKMSEIVDLLKFEAEMAASNMKDKISRAMSDVS